MSRGVALASKIGRGRTLPLYHYRSPAYLFHSCRSDVKQVLNFGILCDVMARRIIPVMGRAYLIDPLALMHATDAYALLPTPFHVH
jgi:hypothetical protein